MLVRHSFSVVLKRNRLISGFSFSGDRDDDVFSAYESQSSYAFFSFRKAWDYLQKRLNFCLFKTKRENFSRFVKGEAHKQIHLMNFTTNYKRFKQNDVIFR